MNTGKKILFISYDGLTDPLGQSQVIPYLAGLTRYGYNFTILSCDKPRKYKEKKKYVENLLAGLPIDWVSIPYHKFPPVFSSVYDLQALKNKIISLHKEKHFDMVHTRPGIPTLAALWLKKRSGVKFLNDVRGFWADERVDGGMWDLKKPLFKKVYNYFKKHEYECLEQAEYNTCLTHVARTEMLTWKNIKAQPLQIDVIPCSADLELFNANNIDQKYKDQLGIELKISKDDFIISYLGSIGGWYLTDEMMRFCKLFSEKMPSAKFLFISPHRHEDILAAAGKHGLSPSKIIIRNASRHEVPVLLSFSNFSIFFIRPCYSKISSSPTKHGEIMAMGIPVITNNGVGDVSDIVQKYNAGFVAEDFSNETFNGIIQQIVSGKRFNADEIRRGAVEIYSLTRAIESYAAVYKKILG